MDLVKPVYAAIAKDIPEGITLAYEKVGEWLGAAVNIVFFVGIAICLIFAIIGGIKYATSGGDPKAAGMARDTITNAVIGFVVVLGFRFIMTFVVKLLGGTMPATLVPGY